MKLKQINESVLDLVDKNTEDMVVADAGLVLADEIANKAADRKRIKKETEQVMKQTNAIVKETNAEKPAEILESLNESVEITRDNLIDFLWDRLMSNFEDSLVAIVSEEFEDYNPDWCADEYSDALTEAAKAYISAIADRLLANKSAKNEAYFTEDEKQAEEKKALNIPVKQWTTPEEIVKINNELTEKANAGKIMLLREENGMIMLAEPAINGIYVISTDDKGYITKIALV